MRESERALNLRLRCSICLVYFPRYSLVLFKSRSTTKHMLNLYCFDRFRQTSLKNLSQLRAMTSSHRHDQLGRSLGQEAPNW